MKAHAMYSQLVPILYSLVSFYNKKTNFQNDVLTTCLFLYQVHHHMNSSISTCMYRKLVITGVA